jgi:hypothetical protein
MRYHLIGPDRAGRFPILNIQLPTSIHLVKYRTSNTKTPDGNIVHF